MSRDFVALLATWPPPSVRLAAAVAGCGYLDYRHGAVVPRRRHAILVAFVAMAVAHSAAAKDDDTTEPNDDAAEPKDKDATPPKDAAEPKNAADSKEKDADEPKKEEDTGHGFQFGVRAGFVFGYKMDFRYDRSPFCRSFDDAKSVGNQQKVCGFVAPPGLEVAVSFALFNGFEPYIFGRFGFSTEKETDTKPLQLYGVGARIYTMSDSRFKIYIEPALAIEAEGGAGNPTYARNSPEYKTDVVFHAAAGPQYDFSKLVGIYLNAGLDVGILRSINATLLVNIGAQLRFP